MTNLTESDIVAINSKIAALNIEVNQQAEHIRCLRAQRDPEASQIDVKAAVKRLLSLKDEVKQLESSLPGAKESLDPAVTIDRTKLEDLLKKRFFFAPAFSIYGSVAGLYDYGPPGCAVQANILHLWRLHFINEEQMLEMDTTIMTPHDVLKTSGHVDRFTDLMVKDVVTGDFFRADHLLEGHLERLLASGKVTPSEKEEYQSVLAQIDNYGKDQLGALLRKYQVTSPEAGNALTDPVTFNLMFDTQIGPTGYLKGYLRPETAQGQFVNFKRLLECNNERMPFASAQIGRAFRNEISPRSGLLRVREFTMAEIEHYVHPERKEHSRFHEVQDYVLHLLPAKTQLEGKTTLVAKSIGDAVAEGLVNNQTLGYFLVRIHAFLVRIGIDPSRLRFRQHMSNEMGHYASDCWDAEIHSSYGWIECVGCADRAAFDLTMHSRATRESLVARERLAEPVQETKYVATVNKKLVGTTFKRDAKAVQAYFESLTEIALIKLRDELKVNNNAQVTVQEGLTVSVTHEMVQIEQVTETIHVREYIPSVIEPSFGIGRIMYSLFEHVYYVRPGDDEARHVLKFPAVVAPVKCLLAPLSSNDVFVPLIREIGVLLRKNHVSFNTDDSGAAIGRRYARNDEIGIPFAITVDFQTVQDRTVTVRERDSMAQIRVPMDDVAPLVSALSLGDLQWEQISTKYPKHLQQQLN